MRQLTERQKMILDYISDSIYRLGYPPTLREIGEYMNISSVNGVNDHLKALERKGFISREGMKSRTLRLVKTESSPFEPVDLSGRFVEVPVVGRVAAGQPVLALENVDHELVDSVEKAMRFVKTLNSPWFNVYPDIGNMTAAGYSPLEQLPLAEGHLVGVHVKDTRPGELRGVPLEQGIVPFLDTFRLLSQMGFAGPLVMEMWAHLDQTGDPINSASHARVILEQWINQAWDNMPLNHKGKG